MLNKEDFGELIQETAIWWAANWDTARHHDDRHARFVAGGSERLDELTATMGYEIGRNAEIGAWQKFEKTLAILASELRFRIFEDREAAAHAAMNIASTVLQDAGYRPHGGSQWATFSQEFLKSLFNPKCYDPELRQCIQKSLRRR